MKYCEKILKTCMFIALVFIFLPELLYAQVDFNELNFDESFRDGVLRFHRGNYNEAILAFQRSLSFIPNSFLARVWLGRSYYHSGFEDAALNEWQRIASIAPPFLGYFIDSLNSRWSLAEELQEDFEFYLIEEFSTNEFTNALRNPAGMAFNGNGNFLLASFGNNSVNIINQNGLILQNLSGGLRSLSGPFDIEVYNDNIYVTNYLGDSISVLSSQGNTVRFFGSTGIQNGELIGPQYISISNEPAVYVSDHGNRRVVKFTPQGDYLFHFGEPESFRQTASVFEGFTKITGITAVENGIFVADNGAEHAHVLYFDRNGNIVERYPFRSIPHIENMSTLENGNIIITSRNEVYLFDPNAQVLNLLYRANENENAQFVSAHLDDNGNLLVSDFRNSRVLLLSRLSGIYSGYQLEIQRVDSMNFPQILVEVSVRDFIGNSIIGLSGENFVFTENGSIFNNWQLEYTGSIDTESSVAVILESSENFRNASSADRQQDTLIRTLQNLPENTDIKLYSAGISPVLVYDTEQNNPQEILSLINSITRDREWKLDQAIRLAGDQILADQKKREIVFIGSGALPDWAFENIGLSATLAYMKNNQIRFSFVQTTRREIDLALMYLVEQTNGKVYNGHIPSGLVDLEEDMIARRTGIYMFSMNSALDDGFGREYLPIEVEVFHFAKSGRDESGYFAPLEF